MINLPETVKYVTNLFDHAARLERCFGARSKLGALPIAEAAAAILAEFEDEPGAEYRRADVAENFDPQQLWLRLMRITRQAGHCSNRVQFLIDSQKVQFGKTLTEIEPDLQSCVVDLRDATILWQSVLALKWPPKDQV